MFNKILIANRGEIACRIIRTARRLGIQTVAVYSIADSAANHVKDADEAYFIGEALAHSSYLNFPLIIQAALTCGATAIHPGYGFLSENPQFAEACTQAGIAFIGPSVGAMEAMASKQLAKQLLSDSDVPLVPGYHGDNQRDEHLHQQAIAIGFPILIKAANGGGGKGMRVVSEEVEFAAALAGCRREALASFGDSTVILEKLIEQPRHIEVQIIADNFNTIIHLFDRDCSIQRRHQKIIEEAPAPDLKPETREAILAAACRVAAAIGYTNAGTVEFLLDKNEQFYFMEMNTRLQVEHPVTEMITGRDLVEWQIMIAANLALPVSQEDIRIKGHAIECRLYAEDPLQQFLPSIGTIDFLQWPKIEGLRIDTGISEGSSISQYYDPMIAKLITWGENRTQALKRMQYALANTALHGIKTNLAFLKAICKHNAFLDTPYSTDFLSVETIEFETMDTSLALIFAATYDYLHIRSRTDDEIYNHNFAWQMVGKSKWLSHYNFDGTIYSLAIEPLNQSSCAIELNDERVIAQGSLNNNRLTISSVARQQSALIYSDKHSIAIFSTAGLVSLQRHTPQSNAPVAVESNLTAPMPSTVVALLANSGDSIVKGQPLIILEAMKMEHTLYAPFDGIIDEFFYSVGAQVDEGVLLLELRAND